MENVNLSPALDPPTLPTMLRAKVVHKLRELQAISAYIDSRLENIDQFLRDFTTQPDIIDVDDAESNNGSTDTPLVSPFLDSDDDSNEGEKAYNTIMVYGLESTGMNLVTIVRDVYVFVGSFTYMTDFVGLEDIGGFILKEMAEVVMGIPLEES
ncbi:hypothetical protein Tco_0857938 [Tanacetum coccineum]|uniref:Uncharacterized protein n=1 Tax=Tanacetum coccineum TaxID=301880 RepID=A0ABQ5B7M7_9ASTR